MFSVHLPVLAETHPPVIKSIFWVYNGTTNLYYDGVEGEVVRGLSYTVLYTPAKRIDSII